MPKPLTKLHRLLKQGLEQTASLWTPIACGYAWVYQVTMILKNEVQLDGLGVQERLRDLLKAMERWQAYSGELAVGTAHLLKVTRSYWSGLFHCYDIEGLPRTNNDLEHVFGKWRHHQRRCTGRKVIPALAVIRGSVQLVAPIATQLQSYSASDLASVSRSAWQLLRVQLQQHQHKRVQQRHFRRSPTTYLASLEQQLFKLTLPS